MDKKTIIILIVSILFFVGAIGVYFFVNSTVEIDDNVGKEFVLPEEEPSKTKDLDNITYVDFSFENNEGNLVKLSESKDKATMILFWNPDNKDSVDVLKKIDSMNEKYEKINFYMINTSEDIPKELEDSLTIDVYYDNLNEGVSKFYITEQPAMIYIQKNNEVLHAKTGLTTTDALEANFDILSENF